MAGHKRRDKGFEAIVFDSCPEAKNYDFLMHSLVVLSTEGSQSCCILTVGPGFLTGNQFNKTSRLRFFLT